MSQTPAQAGGHLAAKLCQLPPSAPDQRSSARNPGDGGITNVAEGWTIVTPRTHHVHSAQHYVKNGGLEFVPNYDPAPKSGGSPCRPSCAPSTASTWSLLMWVRILVMAVGLEAPDVMGPENIVVPAADHQQDLLLERSPHHPLIPAECQRCVGVQQGPLALTGENDAALPGRGFRTRQMAQRYRGTSRPRWCRFNADPTRHP